jgi:hypothetical protein
LQDFKDREGDASQLNRLIFLELTTLALAIARSDSLQSEMNPIGRIAEGFAKGSLRSCEARMP